MNLLRPVLAEAIGTFVFFTIGYLSLVSATVLGQGSATFVLLTVPFGFGLGLFAAIWLFGHISGGHFNPAVTLAALVDGRIDIPGAVGYVVAQVVGAFGAAFAVFFIVGQSFVAYTNTAPGVAPGQAFGAETVMTAIFIAVILTVTRRQPNLASFAIALTLVVIHFALIPITGSSVNPARSLAPAVVSAKYDGLWIYLTAPFLGALIGWAVYRFFNPPDAEELAEAAEDEDEFELDEDELDETAG
jgi:aquaporin Z